MSEHRGNPTTAHGRMTSTGTGRTPALLRAGLRPPARTRVRAPDNPRYPDPRIYGSYACETAARYVPHPFEHTCFKPRKEDYKPPSPATTDGDEELCVRKDHRMLTVDEQNRSSTRSRRSTP